MRSVILSVVVVALVGCGGGYDVTGPPSGEVRTVDAVGITSWSPSQITVRTGESVTFRNASDVVHNVRFDQDVVGHPADVADFSSASRSVTFETPGTFEYHCGIHPAMHGQIVVEP